MSFFSRKKQPTPSSNSSNSSHPIAQPRDTSNRQLQQTQQPPQVLAQGSKDSHSPTLQSSAPVPYQTQQPPRPNAQQSVATNMPAQAGPPVQRPAAWPWAVKQLTMLPQSPLPRSQNAPSNIISPAPFPRYGHSVPATSNQNGELFLYGGLVRDSVRNDLYCIAARENSAAVWQVQGEIPSPRVGHASALVSNVLIVWGGDTKTDGRAIPGEKLDDGLYLLNLVTREWTRVEPDGPKPLGRYGHAVTMVGTRFYVFGGQVDGEFLHDLWSFDLNSLVKNEPQWELAQPLNEPPHRRTGHACIAHGELLYVFGGTDGQYHYNDTWVYDPRTRLWTELQCIGFIPAPREGHSAALVDDVIYVFGGRGVDGKDLGDLTGFKISNKRWYMFQNMGPAPSGRSGHSMAAIGSRVYVLGGESYTSARPDEPTAFHVLDSKHIKYPEAASKLGPQTRKPSVGNATPLQQQQNPSQAPHTSTAHPNTTRGASPISDVEALRRAVSPSHSAPGHGQLNGHILSRSIDQPSAHRKEDGMTGVDEANSGQRDSPVTGMSTGRDIHDRPIPVEVANRAKSPPPVGNDRTASPVQQGLSSISAFHNVPINRTALAARSPSPVIDRTTAPADAFYTSHTKTPSVQNGAAPGHQLSASTPSVANDLLRDIRADLDASRKREAWLKALLLKAHREGYSISHNDIADEDSDFLEDGSDLSSAIVNLKLSKTAAQNEFLQSARQATDRLQEAERIRNGALQETAFYRAKLVAREAGSASDTTRLDAERIEALESKLGTLTAEHASRERKVDDLQEEALMQSRLREQAELRASEALRRMGDLESAHHHVTQENVDLHERHESAERSLSEQAERLALQTSLANQRLADHVAAKSQLESLGALQQQHLRFLEQTQATLDASSSRAVEMDHQWQEASQRINELETELADTRADLEARNADAAAATARLTHAENAWAKSREEADSLRSLTTRGLGELLDFHRDLRSEEDRSIQGHAERIRAFEVELTSMREAHAEANRRADDAYATLSEHRTQIQGLQGEQSAVLSRLMSARSQIASAHVEAANLRQQLAASEGQTADLRKVATAAELKHSMLRSYLAEKGVVVDGDDNLRMESQGAKAGVPDAQQEELVQLRNRHREALDQVLSLSSELDQVRSRVGNGTKTGPDSMSESEEARELRQAMAEAEKAHQERMRQLENDYNTAVHYVKGTEKMLRRMKEELAKQKATNQTLQSELEGFRRVGSPSDGGIRSRSVNGRGTPLSDEGHDISLRPQLIDAQRQNQRLITDNQDLRRRLDTVDHDLELLRESLVMAQQEADARANDVEKLDAEVEQLEHALSLARQGRDSGFLDQVSRENAALHRKNEELSKKIELLLEVDQTEFTRERPISGSSETERRASQTSSDHARAFESFSNELDDWQRKLAGNAGARAVPSSQEDRLPSHT